MYDPFVLLYTLWVFIYIYLYNGTVYISKSNIKYVMRQKVKIKKEIEHYKNGTFIQLIPFNL